MHEASNLRRHTLMSRTESSTPSMPPTQNLVVISMDLPTAFDTPTNATTYRYSYSSPSQVPYLACSTTQMSSSPSSPAELSNQAQLPACNQDLEAKSKSVLNSPASTKTILTN